MGKNRQGRDSQNIIVRVPAGTVIKDAENEEILADLVDDGETFIAARGGKGGRGNARFVTATHQAPREWEVGGTGQERWLILELKVIADVGLVGKPNAGKSTLLSKLSAAQPKIADYPFTTLQPNLGIVKFGDYKSFVMADIPGLIEGAHAGKGLGLQFLRHIERTRLICYVIDPQEDQPLDAYTILKNELKKYSEVLLEKPAIVVFSKKDSWPVELTAQAFKKIPGPKISISAVTGAGLKELIVLVWKELSKIFEEEETEERKIKLNED